MALRDRYVRIQLNKGLSTEVDSKTVVPGELTELKNAVFTKQDTISKRFGTDKIERNKNQITYSEIDGIAAGSNRGEDTVIISSDDEVCSYSRQGWTVRGHHVPMQLSLQSIPKGPYEQFDPTTALANNGVRIVVWEDARGGLYARFIDNNTNVSIGSEVKISGHVAKRAKAIVVKNNFHVLYTSGSTLNVAVIPSNNVSQTPSYNQISSDFMDAFGCYDAISVGNYSVVSWRNSFDTVQLATVRPNGFVGSSGSGFPDQITVASGTFGPSLCLSTGSSEVVVAYGVDNPARIVSKTYGLTTFQNIRESKYDYPTVSTVSSGVLDRLTIGAQHEPGTATKAFVQLQSYFSGTILRAKKAGSNGNHLGVGIFDAADAGIPYLDEVSGYPVIRIWFNVGHPGSTLQGIMNAINVSSSYLEIQQSASNPSSIIYQEQDDTYLASGSDGGTRYHVLYEVSSSVKTDRLVRHGEADVYNPYTPINSGTFVRHAMIGSHIFSADRDPYVWLHYPSTIQPTDFMYRITSSSYGLPVAKSRYAQAQANVSGVISRPQVTSSIYGGSIAYHAVPHRDQFATVSTTGSAFTDRSTKISIAEIHRSSTLSPLDIGDVLYLNGGQLSMYDGDSVTEVGFHLGTEQLSIEAQSGTLTTNQGLGMSGSAGVYTYVAIPEWYDALGNRQQGGPAFGSQVVTTLAWHNRVAITGSTITHTLKDGTRAENIRWAIYRSKVNGTVLQRIDDVRYPILNSTGSDYWIFVDTKNDGLQAYGEVIYMNPFGGSEAQNYSPPAASIMANSGDRLHLAGCEGAPLTVISSKLRLGEAISFGIGAEFDVDAAGGDVSAMKSLDDRLIIFKQNRIFSAQTFPETNSVIDPTPYPIPQLITSDVGCNTNHNVVEVAGTVAQGLIFFSKKGFRLLDRALRVTDIGGPVRTFDDLTFVAGHQDQNTQQVRFYSDSGTTLVYDARMLQWSRFTGQQPAVDAFYHNGYCAFADDRGYVWVENPDSYLDGSNTIQTVIEFGWLSRGVLSNGLQGLHRVRGIQLLGNKKSNHTIKIEAAYDFRGVWTTVKEIPTSASMRDTGYGTVPYGQGAYGGDGDPVYQHEIMLPKQRVEALRLRISDTDLSGSCGGFELSEMSLQCAGDSEWARLTGKKRY